MTKRIIQFGTSRFLQAHADLFIHEARCTGQDIGPITIVKTTHGDARSQRISAFANSEGFPVIIRGTLNHAIIENTVLVKSVDQAFSAAENWEEIKTIFVKDAELVISNVGESGYSVSVTDQMGRPSENVIPESFPNFSVC